MAANSFDTLKKVIEDNSEADGFYHAVHEWVVTAVDEDPHQEGECICGQQDLRYMYTIENLNTGTSLKYIGSKCVEHFESSDLNLQVNVLRGLLELRKKILARQRIDLKEDFSREILRWLHEEGAFPGTEYNGNDGSKDYYFLLDMFNKRNDVSEAREKKIVGLLHYTLKPFIKKHPALG